MAGPGIDEGVRRVTHFGADEGHANNWAQYDSSKSGPVFLVLIDPRKWCHHRRESAEAHELRLGRVRCPHDSNAGDSVRSYFGRERVGVAGNGAQFVSTSIHSSPTAWDLGQDLSQRPLTSAASCTHLCCPHITTVAQLTNDTPYDVVQHLYPVLRSADRITHLRESERGQVTDPPHMRCSTPLHPGRLMERLEALGSGRIRSRGHFWLASRPELVCAWDGCGGQVSIGPLGEWEELHPRGTRLVVTGVDPLDRARVRTAFAEIIDATATDTDRPAHDGFDPWLGPISSLAPVV